MLENFVLIKKKIFTSTMHYLLRYRPLVLSMFGHELAPVDLRILKTQTSILELANRVGIKSDLDLKNALDAQQNIRFLTDHCHQITESIEMLNEILNTYFKKHNDI